MSGNKSLHLIPAVWEQRKLGSFTDIKTGSSNAEDAVSDGKYPFYIRSSEVQRSNKYVFDCEAILIPGEGRIGEIFHYANGKFDCHQRVYKISGFRGVDAKFVLYAMQRSFKHHALENTSKATVDSIRLPTLTGYSFSIPEKSEEQRAIGAFLTALDSSIVLHQRESFSSTQAGKRPHDEVDVLVLELLDDVEIDLLGGGHAGVPKTPGDAGDRHPGVEQERGVGVPEAVHGDDRDAQIPAVAGQNAVHRRVVDLPVHEDWLIVGQILQGLGELGDDLPVDLDLPHGGLVFRRHEAVLALVVVGFVDRERLVGEVEVLGGHRQRLGEAHSGLGNQ